MANTNTAPALELSINGCTCAATITSKGRIELSVKTAHKGADRDNLLARTGQVIREMAFNRQLPAGVFAQVAGTKANPFNFCRKVVGGITTGELVVYLVLSSNGRTNHVAATL